MRSTYSQNNIKDIKKKELDLSRDYLFKVQRHITSFQLGLVQITKTVSLSQKMMEDSMETGCRKIRNMERTEK